MCSRSSSIPIQYVAENVDNYSHGDPNDSMPGTKTRISQTIGETRQEEIQKIKIYHLGSRTQFEQTGGLHLSSRMHAHLHQVTFSHQMWYCNECWSTGNVGRAREKNQQHRQWQERGMTVRTRKIKRCLAREGPHLPTNTYLNLEPKPATVTTPNRMMIVVAGRHIVRR